MFNLYIELIVMNIYNIVIGASKNTKDMLFMKIKKVISSVSDDGRLLVMTKNTSDDPYIYN